MAGEEQNMLVADGPEIRHRSVLARAGENIAFDKGAQIGPAAQVRRVEQVLGHAPGAEDGPVNIAARQRVVAVVLVPDAGVEDPVGTAVVPGFLQGDDGVAGDFLPIQQQRVRGDSGHIASPGAVVKGDDAVLLGQGAAAVAAPLDARVQGQGQILPVDQVGTGGVAPVLAPVLGRIGLVKKVVAALPIAEPVGVVERALWIDVVILGPVRVARQSSSGGAQALHQGIGCQLPLLGGQIGGELAAGHGRGKGFGGRHAGSPGALRRLDNMRVFGEIWTAARTSCVMTSPRLKVRQVFMCTRSGCACATSAQMQFDLLDLNNLMDGLEGTAFGHSHADGVDTRLEQVCLHRKLDFHLLNHWDCS